MEKIKIPKIALQLTVEEVQYLNDLISKDTALKGIPTDSMGVNKCPRCGEDVSRIANYCPWCGQSVQYNDSDVIPFTAD